MKKKISKRGGYRPGAGAKKTGRNTTCISFSVHKDFAELIKSMVKSKIIELKQSQNQTLHTEKGVTVVDKKYGKILLDATKATIKNIYPKAPVSDYLKSRRSKKLGLK